jgi:hypothetical protein
MPIRSRDVLYTKEPTNVYASGLLESLTLPGPHVTTILEARRAHLDCRVKCANHPKGELRNSKDGGQDASLLWRPQQPV